MLRIGLAGREFGIPARKPAVSKMPFGASSGELKEGRRTGAYLNPAFAKMRQRRIRLGLAQIRAHDLAQVF